MVLYKCDRCGYETGAKSSYKSHLNRKSTCIARFKDVPCSELLQVLQDQVRCYKCDKCDMNFNNRQAKFQHIKRCKDNTDLLNTIDTLKKEIDVLKNEKQYDVKKVSGGDMVNDVGTMNNSMNKTVNVYLNDFGQENISYLPKEFLHSCFARKDLITLLENIHCDREHPENHNIRVKSQKRNQIEVRENRKWMIKDEDEALEDAIKNGYRILVRHGFKHKKEIIDERLEDESEYHDIRNWLEDIYDDNKERKPIQRKLMLLLLSNQALLLGKDE